MSQSDGELPPQAPGLYLVATPIGNLRDISQRALDILNSCDLIACEDTRTSGKLLKQYGIAKRLISYHEHNEKQQALFLADKIESGQSIALVSDAGTPTLSDPGFRVVRECHKRKLLISAIPGPSSVLAALAASGLPSNAFTYMGFLPAKSAARKRFFEEIKNAFKPEDAKKRDWNEVVVYAKANKLWFTINGKIASEVIDNEKAKRLDKGFIGFHRELQ